MKSPAPQPAPLRPGQRAAKPADIPVHAWQGCYDDSWRGLITDEAFAHPAKFAPGLIRRIFAHGLDRGWWSKGDLVADPFGGIGGGGIMAGYCGLNWLGVELEDRFNKLGNANLAMHRPKWLALGQANCVKLIQGDSRRFAELVGQAAGVVTSPPYSSMSPEKGSGGVDIQKQWNTYRNSGGGQSLSAFIATQEKHSRGYGSSDGQIGALKEGDLAAVVTSPPYNKPFSQDHNGSKGGKRSTGETETSEAGSFAVYGKSAGQIEGLPNGSIDAVVTSPPYAESLHLNESPEVQLERLTRKGNFTAIAKASRGGKFVSDSNAGYGGTDGNIGNEAGETYWAAMKKVYSECLIAIRPGGYMAVVVKDYVKDKARVPLCDQTLQLLMHIGFEPVERIHAMLVRETRHNNLFGGETVKKTERKSFFRRLAESKGSPRIDHEEVLVVRKPGVGGAA